MCRASPHQLRVDVLYLCMTCVFRFWLIELPQGTVGIGIKVDDTRKMSRHALNIGVTRSTDCMCIVFIQCLIDLCRIQEVRDLVLSVFVDTINPPKYFHLRNRGFINNVVVTCVTNCAVGSLQSVVEPIGALQLAVVVILRLQQLTRYLCIAGCKGTPRVVRISKTDLRQASEKLLFRPLVSEEEEKAAGGKTKALPGTIVERISFEDEVI